MQTINPVETGRKAEGCETISVPEAGRRYFGMSRNASYMAAGRGEIPIVRIGRLMRVPVRALERMLDQASQRSAS
jgi:ribosomal protein S14